MAISQSWLLFCHSRCLVLHWTQWLDSERRNFATALIITTVREQHPRSHHKGATDRVRTGDRRYPVLCHYQLGQLATGDLTTSESGPLNIVARTWRLKFDSEVQTQSHTRHWLGPSLGHSESARHDTSGLRAEERQPGPSQAPASEDQAHWQPECQP